MQQVEAKTILSQYRECGWFGSNYNMNLYRGCCHGCIYCDSRSECYGVENFDTVRKKKDALHILEKELRAKRKTGIVITGSMSDSYNPFEKKECLTQGALKLFAKYGFGCCVDTKSDLVVRDKDILLAVKENAPVVVNFTITTADDNLCKMLERNVSVSSARFNAIAKLAQSGIMCGVLLMPILPFINDTEENITNIVKYAAQSGARWVYGGVEEFGLGVTLRQNQRDYYYMWLDKLFPNLKEKYISTYGSSYNCISLNNKKLCKTFVDACEKYNMVYYMGDIVKLIKSGESTQLSLF